jgi:hypothetical protein
MNVRLVSYDSARCNCFWRVYGQGSSIVSSFASKVVGTVNTGSLNVASRIANSNALPLFVLFVILVASMIIARIVFSNFLAALKTVFSCRFLRCNFDVETEE